MPYPGDISEFADFQQYLIGTWVNKEFGTDASGDAVGGPDNPLSYNIMPLPQVTQQPDQEGYPGYILKNFKYTETLQINDDKEVAIPALAPNRGGRFNQDPRALFYEQQVKFAEGPADGNVVHVENGSWLYLRSDEQEVGPYNKGGEVHGRIKEQPPELTVAKQIAVPHGNSVLAYGSFDDQKDGAPEIEQADAPYPKPDYLSVEPYDTKRTDSDNYQNPHPEFTNFPNKPLKLAVDILDPDAYIHWRVSTDPLDNDEEGVITNIPFQERLADVTEYDADYWLLSTDDGQNFDHLAYTQTMCMEMIVNGREYEFPHVTCNVITREN